MNFYKKSIWILMRVAGGLLKWHAWTRWISGLMLFLYLNLGARAGAVWLLTSLPVFAASQALDLPLGLPAIEPQNLPKSLGVVLGCFTLSLILLHVPLAQTKASYDNRRQLAYCLNRYALELFGNHGRSDDTWDKQHDLDSPLIAAIDERLKLCEGTLTISTPSGIYFYAKEALEVARDDLLNTSDGREVIKCLEALALEAHVRTEHLRAFSGALHLIVPEYRDTAVQKATTMRLRTLGFNPATLKKIKQAADKNLADVVWSRRARKLETHLHRVPTMLCFRAATTSEWCLAQEVPNDDFGVLQTVLEADLSSSLGQRRLRAVRLVLDALKASNC